MPLYTNLTIHMEQLRQASENWSNPADTKFFYKGVEGLGPDLSFTHQTMLRVYSALDSRFKEGLAAGDFANIPAVQTPPRFGLLSDVSESALKHILFTHQAFAGALVIFSQSDLSGNLGELFFWLPPNIKSDPKATLAGLTQNSALASQFLKRLVDSLRADISDQDRELDKIASQIETHHEDASAIEKFSAKSNNLYLRFVNLNRMLSLAHRYARGLPARLSQKQVEEQMRLLGQGLNSLLQVSSGLVAPRDFKGSGILLKDRDYRLRSFVGDPEHQYYSEAVLAQYIVAVGAAISQWSTPKGKLSVAQLTSSLKRIGQRASAAIPGLPVPVSSTKDTEAELWRIFFAAADLANPEFQFASVACTDWLKTGPSASRSKIK